MDPGQRFLGRQHQLPQQVSKRQPRWIGHRIYCDVVLNGSGAPGNSRETQRVPISMRVERQIQTRLLERLGGDDRAATEAFVAREFAKCEQANPAYVGPDEWFSRDGAKELSIRQ